MDNESLMSDLGELVSRIEAEFPDVVGTEIFQLPEEPRAQAEIVAHFRPTNPAAASMTIRHVEGNYSIFYADEFVLTSGEEVPDGVGFDWALEQIRSVARFGLVFVKFRWFFGLLTGSQWLVPTSPVDSEAFQDELRDIYRPTIERLWGHGYREGLLHG